MDFFKNLKNLKSLIKRPAGSFLSLLAFVLILFFSWFYLSQPDKNTQEEELHGFLQNEFQNLISDQVAKNHPEVEKIVFHKIWTEKSSNPKSIKIFFNYSLQSKGDSGGKLNIDGTALLVKTVVKADGQEELWTVKDFKVKDSSLDFSDPLLIKAPEKPTPDKTNP